jgi:FAD:protein FMN transferase
MKKETRILMGMPISVEIVDGENLARSIEEVFSYLAGVDARFSTYKPESEISRINKGELPEPQWSEEMKEVFALSEETKRATGGYFDIIARDGTLDPSGLVKGWAIRNAADILSECGHRNFFIDAGGDIQTAGRNESGEMWSVGIRDPFDPSQQGIVRVVQGDNLAVATSGTYVRGQHIYNPKSRSDTITDIVSLTVIGPDIFEADRFATAAFAMGKEGIAFIENLPGFEGFVISTDGIGTETSGFEKYTT